MNHMVVVKMLWTQIKDLDKLKAVPKLNQMLDRRMSKGFKDLMALTRSQGNSFKIQAGAIAH